MHYHASLLDNSSPVEGLSFILVSLPLLAALLDGLNTLFFAIIAGAGCHNLDIAHQICTVLQQDTIMAQGTLDQN